MMVAKSRVDGIECTENEQRVTDEAKLKAGRESNVKAISA